MKIAVAIDGPAAAGKSTVAKKVAEIKGYTYIDTGAMYRAFTWYCLEKGVDCQNEAQCVALIPEVRIKLRPGGTVLCNDMDITRPIREPRVSGNVSYIASYKDIRLFLVDQQRAMAGKHSADVKIFQIASVETRAIRRYDENVAKGIPCPLAEIEEDVRKRDYIDSHRDFAPLKPAADSILLDTSFMSVDEVVDAVIKIIDKKIEEKEASENA